MCEFDNTSEKFVTSSEVACIQPNFALKLAYLLTEVENGNLIL